MKLTDKKLLIEGEVHFIIDKTKYKNERLVILVIEYLPFFPH